MIFFRTHTAYDLNAEFITETAGLFHELLARPEGRERKTALRKYQRNYKYCKEFAHHWHPGHFYPIEIQQFTPVWAASKHFLLPWYYRLYLLPSTLLVQLSDYHAEGLQQMVTLHMQAWEGEGSNKKRGLFPPAYFAAIQLIDRSQHAGEPLKQAVFDSLKVYFQEHNSTGIYHEVLQKYSDYTLTERFIDLPPVFKLHKVN